MRISWVGILDFEEREEISEGFGADAGPGFGLLAQHGGSHLGAKSSKGSRGSLSVFGDINHFDQECARQGR